ncbi:MAG: hypothetical protein ABI664_01640 [bacterium]
MQYGVGITSPASGSVPYQGSITVTGVYGTFLPFGGNITKLFLDVTFGPGGTSTRLTLIPPKLVGSSGTWQVTGNPGPNMRGTQSFNIIAKLTGTYDQLPDASNIGLDAETAGVTMTVIDKLPPSIVANGFVNGQAQVTSQTFPMAYLLSGSASDPDSNVIMVRVGLDSGNLQLANNTSGDWSQWSMPFSLTAGLHSFVLQVLDAGGHLTQQVVFLAVSPPPVNPPPTPTASITSWTRLEPHANRADIGTSSMARVFDPLWMLTRQWQVGEFQAEDAGSPVQSRVRATSAMLTRCHLGELPAMPMPPAPLYNPATMPLEVLVERRPARSTAAMDPRMLPLEVEAALHFLRMLEAQSLTQYRSAFLTRFALALPAAAVLATTDDSTRRFVQSMAGRAPDARQLVASFRSGGPTSVTIDPALQIGAADLTKVQQTAQAWLAWYDAVISELPAPASDPWNPARLEYAVSVGTRLSAIASDEVTLSASEFDDGRLDWSNFDLDAQASLGTAGDTPFVALAETTIPSPVTFRGAPATRFWEMEDARVAYGLLSAGPTDLAHLMMIEYASTYGNDWYVVPLTIPVGSVTRVDSLVVTDTFGVQSLLRPIGDSLLPTPYWSMWQPALRQRPAAPANPFAANRFFLPPALGHVIEGGAVEDVLFMRDEVANLAWAIERQLESPIEQGIMQQSSARVAPPLTSSGLPRYLLSSTVPDNWIPLLPVQVPAGSGKVRLKRGAVLQPDGTSIVHSAKSQLLSGAPGLALFDEEVPREGVRLTRSRRMTRWLDGSTWVWTAFQREIGRGEGSSGLQFDQLLPGTTSATPVAPPPPPPTSIAGITALTTTAISVPIGGAAATYSAIVVNSGPVLPNVVLQGWMHQGTARRAAAGSMIVVGGGTPSGVLPTGTFTVAGSIAAFNTGGGSGILVAGPATFELELTANGTLIQMKTLAVTLV